jgi:hypothetical protein
VKVRSVDTGGQEEPARVHQDVALAPSHALGPVVAALRTSYGSGFHHPAVDDGRAGVGLAPFRDAHRLAKTVVSTKFV